MIVKLAHLEICLIAIVTPAYCAIQLTQPEHCSRFLRVRVLVIRRRESYRGRGKAVRVGQYREQQHV